MHANVQKGVGVDVEQTTQHPYDGTEAITPLFWECFTNCGEILFRHEDVSVPHPLSKVMTLGLCRFPWPRSVINCQKWPKM